MCILALVAVSLMLKLPARENTHWKDKLRRIDFLGALVLVGAVLGFLLGLDRGSNVSWSMPLTIVSLSVSVVLFVVFILVEVYFAAEPFAPGHIIFSRTFFALYCCNFFSFGGWLAALFYIPLYFQAVDGVSATVAGLRLLPSILAGVSGSLLSGIIMRRTGKYFWLTIVAYFFLTLGCFTIYLCSGGVSNSTVPMVLGMVMAAFGNGIGVTTTLIGLSTYYVISCIPNLLTDNSSFQCNIRGPGRGHCLLVSLPLPWVCDRPVIVLDGGTTTPSRTTETTSQGQQRYRLYRQRSPRKSRLYQKARPRRCQGCAQLLWLVNQQGLRLHGGCCVLCALQRLFHARDQVEPLIDTQRSAAFMFDVNLTRFFYFYFLHVIGGLGKLSLALAILTIMYICRAASLW